MKINFQAIKNKYKHSYILWNKFEFKDCQLETKRRGTKIKRNSFCLALQVVHLAVTEKNYDRTTKAYCIYEGLHFYIKTSLKPKL